MFVSQEFGLKRLYICCFACWIFWLRYQLHVYLESIFSFISGCFWISFSFKPLIWTSLIVDRCKHKWGRRGKWCWRLGGWLNLRFKWYGKGKCWWWLGGWLSIVPILSDVLEGTKDDSVRLILDNWNVWGDGFIYIYIYI